MIKAKELIGERQVLFKCLAPYSVQSKSYCSMALISEEDMDDFLVTFPHIKAAIQRQIFSNPYDSERDFFFQSCWNNIQYLKALPKEILQSIYYSSSIFKYDFG